MEEEVSIYILVDPRTNQVRYVGKTKGKLNKRLNSHIFRAKANFKSPIYSWIRKLLRYNLRPVIQVQELCTESLWEERECYWIKYYRGIYNNLTNVADGGITPLRTLKVRESALNERKLKAVHKYDMDGNFIESYKSCAYAAKVNNIFRSGIAHCAAGKLLSYHNNHWSFTLTEKIKIRERVKKGYKKGHCPSNKGKKLSQEWLAKLVAVKKVPVIHIETGEIYSSLQDAASAINIPYNTLTSQLFFNASTCKFKYLDETRNKPKINKKKRKVIDIDSQKIYSSITEAVTFSGFSKSKMENLLRHNNGKYRYYEK